MTRTEQTIVDIENRIEQINKESTKLAQALVALRSLNGSLEHETSSPQAIVYGRGGRGGGMMRGTFREALLKTFQVNPGVLFSFSGMKKELRSQGIKVKRGTLSATLNWLEHTKQIISRDAEGNYFLKA